MKKLLIVTLILLVFLLTSCGGVVPEPPAEAEKFVGMWENEDQQNIYIVVARCNIELISKKLYIDIWTRVSTSSENYIGQFVVDSKEAKDGSIEINYVDGLGTNILELKRVNNKLKIITTFYPFNPTWNITTTTDYLIKTS